MSESKNNSIFNIFMHDDDTKDLMGMNEIKNQPFLELAFHLDQLSSSHLIEEDSNQYINELKELKSEQLYDLFKTMAFSNFNSSLIVEQLIWIIGEKKQLHGMFLHVIK
jgi:hypothetical protein